MNTHIVVIAILKAFQRLGRQLAKGGVQGALSSAGEVRAA